MSDLATILAELRALNAKVDKIAERPAEPDVILTREQAAQQLKVSLRQLQRLVRAGRIMAHPSGIASAELERYAKTPQTRLSNTTPRRGAVSTEAAQLREMLRLRRGRR